MYVCPSDAIIKRLRFMNYFIVMMLRIEIIFIIIISFYCV